MFRNLLIPFLPSLSQLRRREVEASAVAAFRHRRQAEYHNAMAKLHEDRVVALGGDSK